MLRPQIISGFFQRRFILALALLLLVASCGPPVVLEMAAPGGHPAAVQRIFLVTNRDMGVMADMPGARSDVVSRAVIDVGIPLRHAVGRVEIFPGDPDPERGFTVLSAAAFASELEFLQSLEDASGPDEDIVVFVHGYNNSLGSAVYRHAQIAHDFGLQGLQVTFSWPSAAKPLGYIQDRDSIEIARDDLEELLLELSHMDRKILLVGHSMGAQLITETLRQMSIGGERQAFRRLGVILASPDIDMDLFRSQLNRIHPRPEPFIVMISQEDRVLGISARLAGQSDRLGSTSDIAKLRSLGVSVVDFTSLSGLGGEEHLLAVTSPTAIAVLRGLSQSDPGFGLDGPTILDVADVLVTGATAP